MTQAIPQPPPPPSTHDGYRSEDDKRKFTITAGILGAVFFFLQMLVPFIAMMLMMPAFFMTSFNVTEYDLEGAAVHDNTLYFFGEKIAFGNARGTAQSSFKLMKLDLKNIPETELAESGNPFAEIFGSSDKESFTPKEITLVEDESTWLLPGGEDLLIISQSRMWKLEGDTLVQAGAYPALGNTSRPFYYEGSPAVIEGKPDGLSLAVFEDGRWTRSPIFLEKGEDFRNAENHVQVVSIDGTNHIFLQIGKTLFHRIGLPIGSPDGAFDGWQGVGAADYHWLAFASGGKPAVLCGRFDKLRIYTLENNRWSPTSHLSIPNSFARDFVPLSTGDSLRVVATGFPGSLKIYSIRGDQLVLNARIGGGFPFPKTFMPMMFIPHIANLLFPILLAVILSGLMLKHRVSVHSHGGETAQYASLTRRALAQVVDGMIVFIGMLPLTFSWLKMFSVLEDGPPSMMFPIMMVASFGFAFLWMLFLLFAFSLGEGKWGVTPGKWLVGIRVVGTDLRPCGFGRALLRNFLKVVDGFFNFLVGILIVTFTKDWQRVGDMAARTIVIRKEEA